MKCNTPIEIKPRLVVYCDKELDKRDENGRGYHDGPCEPRKPPCEVCVATEEYLRAEELRRRRDSQAVHVSSDK